MIWSDHLHPDLHPELHPHYYLFDIGFRHDRVEAVRWLLKRGLLPSRRDELGRDALMHAAATGSRQVGRR